jgi:ABC-2 type transport system permease protein
MRIAFLILEKDVRRRLRSPAALLCNLAIPIVLTLIVGVVFGRGGDVSLPRIKVLLVDEDKSFAANFFKQGMKQGKLAELVDLVEVDRAAGHALMEKGKASALIEIPAGFTETVLDGKPAAIVLLKNPSEQFLPLIVEEITETMAVMMNAALRIFGDPLERLRSMFRASAWPSGGELTSLVESAKSGVALVRPYIADSLLSIRTTVSAEPKKPSAGKMNIFAFIMPGSIMIGLLFISEITMRDILRERRAGTLERILAGPVDTGTVLAGKVLSAFAITFVSCLLLLAIGRLGFGIQWGSPGPLFVHLVGSILMCVGIMALIYGAIKSDRVADAMLPVVIIVICILGGAMFPYEVMGRTMQRFAPVSPAFWVIDGIKKVTVGRAGFAAIAQHLAYVYGVGAATTLLGAVLLGAKVRRRG